MQFANCTLEPSSNAVQSSFDLCFSTDVADYYDVVVLMDGVPISSTPCFACAHIFPLELDHAEVHDLESTMYAGSRLSFGVVLYDTYDNIIPPSSNYDIQFRPDPYHSISPDLRNISSTRYNFVLTTNRTEVFIFTLYINDTEMKGCTYSVSVIPNAPSSLSVLSMLSEESQLIAKHLFEMEITLYSRDSISIPATFYSIALRLTLLDDLSPFLDFEYCCFYENRTSTFVYKCFVQTHVAASVIIRVYIGELESMTTQSGSNVVWIESELPRAVILQDVSTSIIRLTKQVTIAPALLSCSNLEINISFESIVSIPSCRLA